MVSKTRKSKYSTAVQSALARRQHATNAQLADDLRDVYPDVSDTTVHRVTQRLVTSGQCIKAPLAKCGSRRFDANTTTHDHFECTDCQQLRDINVSDEFRDEIRANVGDCSISGPLTIQGVCQKCLTKRKV